MSVTLHDALRASTPYGTASDSSSSLIETHLDVDIAATECAKPSNSGASALIANIVLGASDGSTVPFALAAGLASTTSDSRLVLTGVVAELAAGCIAMGLGGYMATQSEIAYASAQRVRFMHCLREQPRAIRIRLNNVLAAIGVPEDGIEAAHARLCRDHDAYADFLLAHESAGDDGDESPVRAAAAVGLSYVVAGALPSLPYLLFPDATQALFVSIVVGIASLLTFGWIKGELLGADRRNSALQTALLGALAASTAYFLASLVG